MPKLRVTTFRDSHQSFTEALDRHGITYSRIMQLSEAPMASGILLEITITGGWGVLAVACLAWAHVKKSRKINIITRDNKVISLEGYSADEAAKFLESARQFAVIDTKPDEET